MTPGSVKRKFQMNWAVLGKHAVLEWINRFDVENYLSSHPRSGRPRFTTAADDHGIVDYCQNHPWPPLLK